jgi:hypothetical protein
MKMLLNQEMASEHRFNPVKQPANERSLELQ